MGANKLYAGAKLREIREGQGISQKRFAEKLALSLPYLSQMEHNHRPISAAVILRLEREFKVDLSDLTAIDSTRLAQDLREAICDPAFGELNLHDSELRHLANSAPAFVRAVLTLHRTYRQKDERLASLSEHLGGEGRLGALDPWEEVRDFFHYCDNYLDPIDRAAEAFATKAEAKGLMQATCDALAARGVEVIFRDAEDLRRYDPQAPAVQISTRVPEATRRFQLLHQLALLAYGDLLESTLDHAKFTAVGARDIAKVGMANYFAGAVQMPYRRFLGAAEAMRHDLERLSHQFSASIEQVAHRLSTLQRPGEKGIPFFFVRVDQAGTITKRHSAARLQFARYGGACPLWNVHRAFETPGRFLRQVVETPDGLRYLSLARDVTKSGGSFHAPVRRYAISLGCEVHHAAKIVYADGLDLGAEIEPIGVSCRICERLDCHQRSVPPLNRQLRVDANHRRLLPYQIIG